MGKPLKEGKALVLLSGGIDSTTALHIAGQECQEVLTLSIYYGQKHDKEIEQAKKIARHFAVPHLVQSLPPDMFRGYGSTLIDEGLEQPKETYQELMESEGVSSTYVPYRNGNFLSVAATLALLYKCTHIYWAPHATDAHHNAYPDCTPEFAGAMAAAIYLGTDRKVRLVTPFQFKTKQEVVELGIKMNTPYELTWSCYVGGDAQCGVCPTCIERIEAFQSAERIDPVPYIVPIKWVGSIYRQDPEKIDV